MPCQAPDYGARWGAEPGVGIEQRGRQALEIGGIGCLNIEVMQLHLGLCPGQRLGALERVAIVVLIDEIEQRLP